MGLAITSNVSTTSDLEKEVKNIERAIGFMADESAVRNTITRLHFFLNKEPQEYAVEYGPSSQFVLPARDEDSIKVLTKEEEEAEAKKVKETNQKFARITEFQESNNEMSSDVKVIAIGNSQSKTLQTKGDVSIYSFPSGEKDEVFIAMALDNTVATITSAAFSSKFEHNYYHLDKEGSTGPEAQQKKVKELFETWLKEKR